MVIEGLCVTVAMYCLIQFYVQIRVDLAEHKPLLKVAAIKLVIFLSFWQTVGYPIPLPQEYIPLTQSSYPAHHLFAHFRWCYQSLQDHTNS